MAKLNLNLQKMLCKIFKLDKSIMDSNLTVSSICLLVKNQYLTKSQKMLSKAVLRDIMGLFLLMGKLDLEKPSLLLVELRGTLIEVSFQEPSRIYLDRSTKIPHINTMSTLVIWKFTITAGTIYWMKIILLKIYLIFKRYK